MTGSRRFLTGFAGACLFVLSAVAAVNFSVDVGRIYPPAHGELDQFATAYVTRLLGSERRLVAPVFERAIKLKLADMSSASCLVVGSSHEMQISVATLPRLKDWCPSLANVAVSGGSLEDLIAMMGKALAKPGVTTVILGLAPWSFRYGADERWALHRDAYVEARARLGLPMRADDDWGALAKVANLVSATYFLRNWEVLRGTHNRAAPGEVVEAPAGAANAPNQAATFDHDGAYRYPQRFLDRGSRPAGRVGDGSYRIAEPFIDKTAAADFELAVSSLQRHDVAVVFLLMPYHPKVLTCSNETVCQAFRTVESYVRHLAGRRGINVIGSYDPSAFGLQARDFIDDMHLERSAIRHVAPLPQGSPAGSPSPGAGAVISR